MIFVKNKLDHFQPLKKTKMKLSSAVLLATAECGPMMGMKPVMMPGLIMPEPVVQTATQEYFAKKSSKSSICNFVEKLTGLLIMGLCLC